MLKTLKYYPFKMCFTIDKPIKNDLQYTGKKSIIGNILKPRRKPSKWCFLQKWKGF